ncbi:MAG: peptidase M61 [Gammaproteobacteria bacterium]|nr:peptidase M61 [Gammaproteobacteria bacterium]
MSPGLSAAKSAPLRGLLAALLATASVLLLVGAASAGEVREPQVAPPKDVPYPGTITLDVDVSDTRQGIYRVHEVIPVEPGRQTLLYPKWIPGTHSAAGPIQDLAGLVIKADGERLKWKRDKYAVYAFHVDVPEGVSRLDLTFQYLSERRGHGTMTDRMLMLEWNWVVLYPAGYYSRRITVRPSVTLPKGWQFGTALETASTSGNTTTFKPVALNTLVDSPIYAGRYFKRVDLNPGGDVPVHLDIVADAPKFLEVTDHQLEVHRNLVTQAFRLFGSHHFDHYDFLLSLSDYMTGNGFEHHRSSENGVGADYFTAWKDNATGRDLLAHEFTHSWNGKYRRPADLWTPNYNVPMGDSLLWVYEGLTQYWGFVLTARSGMWTPEQFRQALAMVAAKYDKDRPGFVWRTLLDTTNDPTAAHRSMLPYRSWQMSEEYYGAGQMLWLAVDAKIRVLTNDRKSLDDFARAFYNMHNGSWNVNTYTFDDIVSALNGVVKYDWAGFLHERVNTYTPPLLSGLKASGWKLVYTDTPSEYEKEYMSRPQSPRHLYNFAWSIGITLNDDGVINDVLWKGPAFKAGVSTGATMVAVNGREFSTEFLKRAIANAEQGKEPIELTLKYQGNVYTVPVDYHGGLRYPHLVRIEGTPDYLGEIIAPRK